MGRWNIEKLNWRHGYVLWLGAGALGRNIDDMGHHPILPNAGVGYRFEVKPAMNIRLDLGFGRECRILFSNCGGILNG